MAKKKIIRNNRYEADKLRRENEKSVCSIRTKTRVLSCFSLVVVILLLLLLFTNWAAIHNSADDSIEVKFTGFQSISAGLSGNYKSADEASFGNLSTFYYFVPSAVRTLCLLTVVTLFVLVVQGVVSLFAAITNKQGAFNVIAILLAAAEAGLFIACYAVARSMNDPMVSGYCKGNPACSVQSTAILPALFAILSLSLPVLRCILSKKAR
ncbi:MAG: hypothetical protein IJT69_03600 [Clostridia bacterium]|nr:hypothetical protein [Clostridia bacterium]